MLPDRGRLFTATCLTFTLGLLAWAELSAVEPKKNEGEKPARADLYGEPLPEGAIARLGTTRLRSEGVSFALSPDGKKLALRHQEIIRICDVASGKDLARLEPGKGATPEVLGFSSDGKMVSTRNKETIAVWDAATGKELWQFQGEAQSPEGVFTADNKHFVGWATDASVRIWEAATGKLVREHKLAEGTAPFRIKVSRDGKFLAAPVDRFTLRVWEMATGKTIRSLPRQQSPLQWHIFAPDRKKLAAVNEDVGEIQLWDLAGGKDRTIPLPNPIYVVSLRFTPDGKTLAAENRDFTAIDLWDVATGNHRFTLESETLTKGFAFAPDGKTLALGSARAIRLVELATGKQQRRLAANPNAEAAIAYSRDGKILVARDGQSVRLWKPDTGEELPGPLGLYDNVRYLAFSPDSKTLATGAQDGTIRLWDPLTGKQRTLLRRRGNLTADLIYSADGKLLASFGRDEGRTARVWDLTANQLRCDFEQIPVGADGSQGVQASFSADGRSVAVAVIRAGTLVVFDSESGEQRNALNLGAGGGVVDSFAFSPDGRVLALSRSVSKGGDTTELRDVATGRILARLDIEAGEEAICSRLIFSPDGKLLAAMQEGAVRIWEVATRKQVHEVKREEQSETFLALNFTPAGQLFALSGEEFPQESLHLWDVFAGKKIHTFQVPGNEFHGYAFSPDGTMLATSLRDTTALVWSLRGLGADDQERPDPPDAAQVEKLWADLAGTDASRGFQAVQTLSAAPQQSLPILKKHLKPVPESETRRLAQLILDLTDNRYRVRKKAMNELEKLGEVAELALRNSLVGRPDLELRMRVLTLLKKREGADPSPEVLRVLRAVQILERMGNAEARQLLEKLAKGASGAWLTLEAQSAVKRQNAAAGGKT